MLLGILSDTHDEIEKLKQAIVLFNKRKVELVIHCGDWVSPFMTRFLGELKCKIISVFGNNEGDIFTFLRKKHPFQIEFHRTIVELCISKKKFAVYHGHSPVILNALISSQNYDYVLSGHTHIPEVRQYEKTLHINPGSCGGVNDERKATVAILNTEIGRAEIIELP